MTKVVTQQDGTAPQALSDCGCAWSVAQRTLLPGDTLPLNTHRGMVAVNPVADVFTLEGLHTAMESAGSPTTHDVGDYSVERVTTFRETALQPHDMTLVVVQASRGTAARTPTRGVEHTCITDAIVMRTCVSVAPLLSSHSSPCRAPRQAEER